MLDCCRIRSLSRCLNGNRNSSVCNHSYGSICRLQRRRSRQFSLIPDILLLLEHSGILIIPQFHLSPTNRTLRVPSPTNFHGRRLQFISLDRLLHSHQLYPTLLNPAMFPIPQASSLANMYDRRLLVHQLGGSYTLDHHSDTILIFNNYLLCIFFLNSSQIDYEYHKHRGAQTRGNPTVNHIYRPGSI